MSLKLSEEESKAFRAKIADLAVFCWDLSVKHGLGIPIAAFLNAFVLMAEGQKELNEILLDHTRKIAEKMHEQNAAGRPMS
jgi:hypothetical protein